MACQHSMSATGGTQRGTHWPSCCTPRGPQCTAHTPHSHTPPPLSSRLMPSLSAGCRASLAKSNDNKKPVSYDYDHTIPYYTNIRILLDEWSSLWFTSWFMVLLPPHFQSDMNGNLTTLWNTMIIVKSDNSETIFSKDRFHFVMLKSLRVLFNVFSISIK